MNMRDAILAALRRSGPPYALNPKELLSSVMISSGGMTKRLDRLEEAGLVTRRPDPSDRRGISVKLTPRGRRTVDRALEIHSANEEALLEPLNADERELLGVLLRKLLVSLEGR